MDARTPLPAPTMWPGLALEVDSLNLGQRVIARQVRDLRAASQAQELRALKQAAEKIAEAAEGMRLLSKHIASTITEHQNRRARL